MSFQRGRPTNERIIVVMIAKRGRPNKWPFHQEHRASLGAVLIAVQLALCHCALPAGPPAHSKRARALKHERAG